MLKFSIEDFRGCPRTEKAVGEVSCYIGVFYPNVSMLYEIVSENNDAGATA